MNGKLDLLSAGSGGYIYEVRRGRPRKKDKKVRVTIALSPQWIDYVNKLTKGDSFSDKVERIIGAHCMLTMNDPPPYKKTPPRRG